MANGNDGFDPTGKYLKQLEGSEEEGAAQAAQARREALEKAAEAQKELNAQLEKQAKLITAVEKSKADGAEKATKELKKQLEIQQLQTEELQHQFAQQEKLLKADKEHGETADADLAYLAGKAQLQSDLIESDQKVAAQAAITDEQKKAAAKVILDLELKIVEAKVHGKKTEEAALVALRKKLTGQGDYSKKALQDMRAEEVAAAKKKKFALQMQTAQKGLQGIASVTQQLLGVEIPTSIGGLVGMFANAARSWDEANVNLMRTTGGAVELKGVMADTVKYGAEFGGDFASAQKAISGVYGEFSLFQQATEDEQKNIAQTAVTLEKLGVSAQTSGQALEIMTRGMGLSTSQATATTLQFDKLAQKLKLPTDVILKDFAKLGPKMSKFGKDGIKQFTRLAEQARKLGMSTQAAFDLSEQMSTFEGASDLAGKLNAQLGLQLNSVKLLRANDADRISMLRDEFKRMGKSWEDLGRFEKRAVADMLGGEEAAQRLLGPKDAMIKFNEEQKEATDRAFAMTTAMDSFKGAMTLMWVELEPHLANFTAWLKQGDAWAKLKFWAGAVAAGLTATLVTMAMSGIALVRQFRSATMAIKMMGGGLDKVNAELAEAVAKAGMLAKLQQEAARATGGAGARFASSGAGQGLSRMGGGMQGMGMKGGMAAMGIGMGAQMLSSGMDEGAAKTTVDTLGTTASYGASGAMMGSMFGPIGTAIGGIGGALFGLYRAYGASQDKAEQTARTLDLGEPVNDFIAVDGTIREFRKDDVVAGGTNLMGAKGMTGSNQAAMSIDYDKLGNAIVTAIGKANTSAKTQDTKVVLQVDHTELGETVIKYINGKYDMVLGK